MKLSRFTSSILVAAGSLFLAASEFSPAQAYSVTFNGRSAGGIQLRDIGLNSQYDIGRTLDSTTWHLDAYAGKTNSQALDAKAVMTVLGFTKNELSLQVDFFNNTDRSYQASIVSFGFGVNPNATGVSFGQVGSTFDSAEIQTGQQNFPGGFKQIDVCVFGANNCSGGNINEGLQSGQSDSFILNITGDFYNPNSDRSEVTLSDLAIKFQTQDGSYELAGVPEPITMAGSGLALGFGALLKRKAAKKLKTKG